MCRVACLTLGVRLFFKSGIAFLDQAILSGANFAITIVLLRTVAKEEYGYYSIAFAVSLFLVSLQNAVVTTPLAVLLAGKRAEEKDEYVGALYWGQIIAAIPAAGIGLAASGYIYFLGLKNVEVLTIAALSFAAVGILQREFLRAYYFAKQSPLIVLRLDSSYALMLLALLALIHWSFRITAPLAFILMGISALATSALFTRRTWKFHWPAIRESYREHWPFAKWSLTGVAVTHVQSYCSLYLTGSLLGSSAAGSFAASRLPLTPMALLQTGWNKVAIPRGAQLRELRKLRQFLREQIFVTAFVAVAVVAYVALLLVSADFLKTVLFGKRYDGVLDLIVFWAAINVAMFAGLTASAGLQVMKEFGAIAKINCITMVVTLTCSAVFISRYGIKGGLVSSLLGETLLSLSLWTSLAWHYFRELDPTPEPNRRDLLSRLFLAKKGVPL
jgi:O-antigen/teichoic acid export membrane protein